MQRMVNGENEEQKIEDRVEELEAENGQLKKEN